MRKISLFLFFIFTLSANAAVINIVNRTDQTVYVRDNKQHHYWVNPGRTLRDANVIGKIHVCWVNTLHHKKNTNCVPLTEVGWPDNDASCRRVFSELIVIGTCNHRLDPVDSTEFCRDRLSPTIECH